MTRRAASPPEPFTADDVDGKSRWTERDRRLSALIDRATVQLEAAEDPEVATIYRRLVAELEEIAFRRTP